MSNRRSSAAARHLQHELDLIHGFHRPECCAGATSVREVEVPGWMRVAAASGLLVTEESSPDKQETPEVGASKVSTDRHSAAWRSGGRSPDSAA